MMQQHRHAGFWSRRGAAVIAGVAALLAVLAGSCCRRRRPNPSACVSVTAQGPAVVIEATEPVAYTVNRPDAADADRRSAQRRASATRSTRVEPKGPVAALRLEQTTAADGLGVARVRIALSRAAEYRVRSSRNTIRVELASATARSGSGVEGGRADRRRRRRDGQRPPVPITPAAPARESKSPPATAARPAPTRRRPPPYRRRRRRRRSPRRSNACARRARARRRS